MRVGEATLGCIALVGIRYGSGRYGPPPRRHVSGAVSDVTSCGNVSYPVSMTRPGEACPRQGVRKAKRKFCTRRPHGRRVQNIPSPANAKVHLFPPRWRRSRVVVGRRANWRGPAVLIFPPSIPLLTWRVHISLRKMCVQVYLGGFRAKYPSWYLFDYTEVLATPSKAISNDDRIDGYAKHN